jgi:hypothetical protein
MTGIGYLRRLGQGLRSMKHPTPMKLQEGKMGYILLWAPGCAHPDPARHLPPARLRLIKGAGVAIRSSGEAMDS